MGTYGVHFALLATFLTCKMPNKYPYACAGVVVVRLSVYHLRLSLEIQCRQVLVVFFLSD